MRGLYAIYDHPHAGGVPPAQAVAALVRGGAAAVQVRAKHATTAARIELLREVAPACRDAAVPLIVNDDLDAALAGIEGVRGVHLGQGDPGFDDLAAVRARAEAAGVPDLLVGISTHDLEQLRRAGRQRPDSVAFGPVVATASKPGHDPVVGFDGLLHACRVAAAPLVAIGGLDAEGGRRAIEVGASAVAMIGALIDDDAAAVEARARAMAAVLADAARPLTLDEVARRIPVVDREQLVMLAHVAGDLGVHGELALPIRFAPHVGPDGAVSYRPCDVLDVLYALDKRPEESWDQWAARGRGTPAGLVQLRRGR